MVFIQLGRPPDHSRYIVLKLTRCYLIFAPFDIFDIIAKSADTKRYFQFQFIGSVSMDMKCLVEFPLPLSTQTEIF
jgi:hypothetical protein